jgi:hypothetical protein
MSKNQGSSDHGVLREKPDYTIPSKSQKKHCAVQAKSATSRRGICLPPAATAAFVSLRFGGSGPSF